MLLCKKPFMAGSIAFGCGQCLHCRISRARQWQYRQLLESFTHDHNCFITLTYDDEHIPPDRGLVPGDVQLFFKRLRKAMSPVRVRYFCVGEYGEVGGRPHYHVNLFGVSEAVSVHGRPFAVVDYAARGPNVTSGLLRDTWRLGGIHLGEFNWKTAGYCCGYITKYLGDRKRGVCWPSPEFSRASRRPGLGADAAKIIGAGLLKSRDYALKERDIPNELRFGGKKFGLGRYMLRKVREEVGFADDYAKQFRDRLSYEKSLEMQSLFVSDESVATFREAYLKASTQARLSQEARHSIYARKATL